MPMISRRAALRGAMAAGCALMAAKVRPLAVASAPDARAQRRLP